MTGNEGLQMFHISAGLIRNKETTVKTAVRINWIINKNDGSAKTYLDKMPKYTLGEKDRTIPTTLFQGSLTGAMLD